jgi:prepilin signal peptidase PulO-like enzyme (type II secretory pathway)
MGVGAAMESCVPTRAIGARETIVQVAAQVAVAVLSAGVFLTLARRALRFYNAGHCGGTRLGTATCAAAGIVALAVTDASKPLSLAFAAGIAACVVCAVTDWKTGYIPDAVTFPAAALLIAGALMSNNLAQTLLGAAAGAAPLAALLIITRGRGLGAGDVKLACCAGMTVGDAARAFVAIEAAFVLGGACAALLLASRMRRRGDTMRFGPFIAAGLLYALAR